MFLYIVNSCLSIIANIFCGLLVFTMTQDGQINIKNFTQNRIFWLVLCLFVANVVINIFLYKEKKSLKNKLEDRFYEALVKNTGIDKMAESLVDVYRSGNEIEFKKRIRMTSDLKKLLGDTK